MERPLPEVLASQDEMLKRRGTPDPVGSGELNAAFRDHIKEVVAWLEQREDIPICRVGCRKVSSHPAGWSKTVCDFLDRELVVNLMARAVDPSLYRNRRF